MTDDPGSVFVGDPVTLTIGKTNILPSDLEWSVKDTCRRAWSSSRRLPAREPALL
jgi:hypothetical protein